MKRRKKEGRVPMETRGASNSQLSLRATSSSHGHLTQDPMIGLYVRTTPRDRTMAVE